MKRVMKSFVATIFLLTLVNTANVLAAEIVENDATEVETTESIRMSGNEAGQISDTEQILDTEVECVHTYTSAITKAPTCTNAGERTFTCSKCGDHYTEPITATGHKEVKDAAVAATCTSKGKTEGSHCSVCGEILVAQKEIPMLSHSYKTTVKRQRPPKTVPLQKSVLYAGKQTKPELTRSTNQRL